MATFHLCVKTARKGKGIAAQHSKYIARQGWHSEKEDLIEHWYGNLPSWSDDPQSFWRCADKYERKNGAVYREYEGALPSELGYEQLRAIVEKFVEQVAPGKPYEVAIHEPIAALGGVPQPHFHLMVSDRVNDGVDRPPEKHFRRFNRAQPHLGGCRKDSGGKSPRELSEQLKGLRGAFANLTNDALEAQGHPQRVDHRSHRERGLTTEPGKHLGPHGVAQIKRQQDKGQVPPEPETPPTDGDQN